MTKVIIIEGKELKPDTNIHSQTLQVAALATSNMVHDCVGGGDRIGPLRIVPSSRTKTKRSGPSDPSSKALKLLY